MMEMILLAIGLVLVIEGLAYALAPWLVEYLLLEMQKLPQQSRRVAGLIAVVIGGGLIWLAQLFG